MTARAFVRLVVGVVLDVVSRVGYVSFGDCSIIKWSVDVFVYRIHCIY